jgi:dimethylargininase
MTAARPLAALVRKVSPRLAEAELTFASRRPIDAAVAAAQHAGYTQALRGLGLTLVWAPPAPAHPDGVFVEDAAVVVDELAIVTRPGAASRRGEVAPVGETLAARGYELAAIEAPATLDGGDVLRLGTDVLVGLGARTNRSGLEALTVLLGPRGHRVHGVAVRRALHLKTAATALPDATVVVVPSWLAAPVGPGAGPSASMAELATRAGFEILAAPEPAGANLLVVGDAVLVSASAPRTAELVAARGFDPMVVDIDQFERAEAGVTCLSVLLDR